MAETTKLSVEKALEKIRSSDAQLGGRRSDTP
jgi:hypothetical protein